MENKMTMKEFEEKYDIAIIEVLIDPLKGLKEKNKYVDLQSALSMAGVILFNQLKKELFKKKEIEESE